MENEALALAGSGALEPARVRFGDWRDLVFTSLVEFILVATAFHFMRALTRGASLDVLERGLIFYAIFIALTFVALWAIRTLGHRYFVPAKFSPQEEPWRAYICFNLYGFLLITNLSLFYINGLTPIVLRFLMYRLLGTKLGKGYINISGKIVDPHFVTLERGVIIGEEALLLGHAFTSLGDKDILLYDHIHIKEGAVVGARSVLLPGVEVGEYSTIKAMSLVPPRTKIPPYELWGGTPAKKIRSLKE